MKKPSLFSTILCLLIIVFGQCSEEMKEPMKANPTPLCALNLGPKTGSLVLENNSIQLSWSRVGNASMYDVYVAEGSGSFKLVGSNVTATIFNYDIPEGTGKTYTWYVEPKNSLGASTGCKGTKTEFTAETPPPIDEQQKVINVLVLNYDPYITFNENKKRVHEFYAWFDPKLLADEYINDVLTSSDSLIKYNIQEWRDLDVFPTKADGFVYTPAEYMACIANNKNCHAADGLDYVKMVSDQNIVEGINGGVFEEVWIFGGPYFGYWEAAMAGPKSFNINGDFYQQVQSNKAFAIMGFNYERGPAEMMHDLCHRTEATMSKVYGGWRVEQLKTSWARFAANYAQSNGIAAVGTCHFPPNAINGYDYANPRFVKSSADDWLTYPVMNGIKKEINSETWGGPDYQRNYLKWWFNHLPRRQGVAPDGKLNNWWRYIFEFNENVIN